MHGVIFAKITSPSRNAVNPPLTSEYGRMVGLAIVPESASTAGIGTNVTGAPGGSASFAGLGGLISQISRNLTYRHPSGRVPSGPTTSPSTGNAVAATTLTFVLSPPGSRPAVRQTQVVPRLPLGLATPESTRRWHPLPGPQARLIRPGHRAPRP